MVRSGARQSVARSSSLMEVLARVCASTRFTMTAQYRLTLPSAEGSEPGTTTDPAGTAALQDLPRGAIVNSRALSDEHAHRDDRAGLDDHTLDNFGASADEAIVFDDRRTGLQWLEHSADTNSAGEVNIAANLRTRT